MCFYNSQANITMDIYPNNKLSLQLFKTFNFQQPPLEWTALNENINLNRRQTLFETTGRGG